MSISPSTEKFKKIIILFWTLWWLTALWTDIVGLLAHYGLLQKSWAPDLNYPFLVSALKMYNLPYWFSQILFAAILLWSLLSFFAFGWACMSFNQPPELWMKKTDLAFMISLSFWLAFFLADQLVMKFDLEENHMTQGGFQLLTYLALYILPAKVKNDHPIKEEQSY